MKLQHSVSLHTLLKGLNGKPTLFISSEIIPLICTKDISKFIHYTLALSVHFVPWKKSEISQFQKTLTGIPFELLLWWLITEPLHRHADGCWEFPDLDTGQVNYQNHSYAITFCKQDRLPHEDSDNFVHCMLDKIKYRFIDVLTHSWHMVAIAVWRLRQLD